MNHLLLSLSKRIWGSVVFTPAKAVLKKLLVDISSTAPASNVVDEPLGVVTAAAVTLGLLYTLNLKFCEINICVVPTSPLLSGGQPPECVLKSVAKKLDQMTGAGEPEVTPFIVLVLSGIGQLLIFQAGLEAELNFSGSSSSLSANTGGLRSSAALFFPYSFISSIVFVMPGPRCIGTPKVSWAYKLPVITKE